MEAQIALLESAKVPSLSLAFMIFSAVMGLAIPIALMIFLKKKYGCHIKHFLIGCAVWIAFAVILEGFCNRLILGSGLGTTIMGNIWLYAIFGGLMAGLFEEFGRFTAFKTVLKGDLGNDKDSLMYGAGHGGVEAIVILSYGMLSNILCSILINAGMAKTLIDPLIALDAQTAQSTVDGLLMLVNEPSGIFLMGLLERILAITGHIAMSVIVWYGVKNKKIALVFLSVGLHAALDALTLIFSKYVGTDFILELIVAVIVAGIVFVAYRVWKSEAPVSKAPVSEVEGVNE